MIAIVDYGVGNLRSVENALKRLGAEYILTSDPETIRTASKVILPGVGNVAEAMANLRGKGLVEAIRARRKPLLGICVGMQVLCRYSEEGDTQCIGLFDTDVLKFNQVSGSQAESGYALPETIAALGMPEGGARWKRVIAAGDDEVDSGKGERSSVSCEAKFQECIPAQPDALIPELKIPHMGWNRINNLSSKLFKNIDEGTYVYFVHSYRPQICRDTIATTDYGGLFSCALKYENFYGTQFHPEKSGDAGEAILKNFLAL